MDQSDLERERQAFRNLQVRLPAMYRRIFPDRLAPRTVLIIPSLSLDPEVLSKVSGAHHYEERMFCLLLLLRYPAARVIYVTSEPVSETIVDYFLHLLPGIPPRHARSRLTLLSCHDGSPVPLTAKILARPRLMARIEEALGDKASAHMTCFNVTPLERTLAVKLGIPIYGCDPELASCGTKSGSRALFREAGLAMPDGCEDLRDAGDVAEALDQLKRRNPSLKKAVVKLNDGFSGDGNAIFTFGGAMKDALPHMAFAANTMRWESFEPKINEMGAVVEAFIEGEDKRSPSAQFRVNPLGEVEAISTHDQVLGGEGAQVFLGCRFPADQAYRRDIQNEGGKAAKLLAERGVLGRFGIDFISVREQSGWRHYAIEVNLRKGGTTHPFIMLQYLTDGAYDRDTGLFMAPGERPRYYYASDNIVSDRYQGLTPHDLIDIAVKHGIHFHQATQEGVVFHLIGALSEFGKLGAVCVAASPDRAEDLYRETIAILDSECGSANVS